MYHLAYVSSAKRELNPEELDELLRKSRENNARLGVTGVLIYADGNFLQILEGDRQTIHALFETIRNDARHDQVTLIDEEPIAHRLFGEWDMHFRRAEAGQIFTEAELAADKTGYLRMLKNFMESMR